MCRRIKRHHCIALEVLLKMCALCMQRVELVRIYVFQGELTEEGFELEVFGSFGSRGAD